MHKAIEYNRIDQQLMHKAGSLRESIAFNKQLSCRRALFIERQAIRKITFDQD